MDTIWDLVSSLPAEDRTSPAFTNLYDVFVKPEGYNRNDPYSLNNLTNIYNRFYNFDSGAISIQDCVVITIIDEIFQVKDPALKFRLQDALLAKLDRYKIIEKLSEVALNAIKAMRTDYQPLEK